MAEKRYVSPKWPELNLGVLQFKDGEYITDNESHQQAIEKHEQFGRNIHFVEPTQLPAEGGRRGRPDQDLPDRRPGAKPDNELPDDDDDVLDPAPKPGGAHLGARGTGTLHKKK